MFGMIKELFDLRSKLKSQEVNTAPVSVQEKAEVTEETSEVVSV